MLNSRAISIKTGKRDYKSIDWIVVLIAISLHQSVVIYNINLSLSDIFLASYVIRKLVLNNLQFPIKPLLFLIVLTITSLFTSFFLTPIIFPITPNASAILVAWLKLLIIFFYFVAGYNIYKDEKLKLFLEAFSVFGMSLGVIGVIFSIIRIDIITQILFDSGVRYKGLVSDPNLYAILCIASFSIFLSNNKIGFPLRSLTWITLFASVLASGSKTGLVVVILFLIIILCKKLLSFRKQNVSAVITNLSIITLIIVAPFLQRTVYFLIASGVNLLPGASRVLIVFNDFYMALGEGGSSRIHAWLDAIDIISESPFLGVGIGNYVDVAFITSGSRVIAHNTYLQLSAEWGVLLTIVFFAYVLFALFRNNRLLNSLMEYTSLSNVLIIILIGSMSISLNNTRLFWVCLGSMIYLQSHKRNHTNPISESLAITND